MKINYLNKDINNRSPPPPICQSAVFQIANQTTKQLATAQDSVKI